ncbi:MAG: hypothetical protein Kow0077_29240 [Anaerolineae bacterium]
MSKSRRRASAASKPGVVDRTTLILLGAAALVLVIATGAWLVTRQVGVPAGYEPEYTGGPRIQVAEPVIDHGYVPFNQTVESVFHIRNVGDQPLRILNTPRVTVLEGC